MGIPTWMGSRRRGLAGILGALVTVPVPLLASDPGTVDCEQFPGGQGCSLPAKPGCAPMLNIHLPPWPQSVDNINGSGLTLNLEGPICSPGVPETHSKPEQPFQRQLTRPYM